MRTLSRWMPGPPEPTPMTWRGYLVLAPFIAGLLYLATLTFSAIYHHPWSLLGVAAFAAAIWFESAREVRRRRSMLAAREGEDIGTFAREFDRRTTDPWVLRAVYEELSKCLGDMPILVDDELVHGLKIDEEDLCYDLVPAIAHRAGRALDEMDRNPWAGHINTVGDLVCFFHHQPRAERVMRKQ